MTYNPEEILDQNLKRDDKGRQIQTDVGDSTWGQLIIPSEKENQSKINAGLRVVIFGSYLLGYLITETLKEFEKQIPARLNIVGLVTDDPASPDAKISVKRRIWRLYNEKETISLETAMIESGLKAGIPVYTGAVKTTFFRDLLDEWKPDVILVCVFGQIIDTPIIKYPMNGIYNFHPADLKAGHGAGPQPFQDLIDRNAETSRLTIHHLTKQLDAGPIVGQSPPVNVRFSNGGMTNNILVLENKMVHTIDIIGTELVKALIHRFERGLKGPLKHLEFGNLLENHVKEYFLNPIQNNRPLDYLPEVSDYVNFKI